MIVITGATGFVGRRLVTKIKKYYPNEKIVCLVWDKDTPLEKYGLEVIKKNKIKFEKIDLLQPKTLIKIPKSPRLVIHLAANTDTATPNHKVNSVGTMNLVKALGKLGPKTHFVHISTVALMGGRLDCSKPLNEESPCIATNNYGRTKLEAEKFLIHQSEKQKFKLTIIRLNTVYGKNPRPDSLFDALKKQVINKSLIARINWPGLTSLVHVDDVVKVILNLSKINLVNGKPNIYLLYSESMTMANISKLIHGALKVKYSPINFPIWFWKSVSISRIFIPLTEKILPTKIYNTLWRSTLIVDNSVYCKTDKLFKVLPNWKPKKLKDHIGETLTYTIGSR